MVADDTFQIPKQVRGEADQLVYRQVLVAIFLEVARPFIPSHSSDIDLGIRCREVASRLHADLQPLRAKMMLVKMPSDSDTESSSSNASLALWNRTIAQDLLHRADEMVQILASETVSQAFWFPKRRVPAILETWDLRPQIFTFFGSSLMTLKKKSGRLEISME